MKIMKQNSSSAVPHYFMTYVYLKYLEWRFDKKTRILGSACFTLQMVLYMAIVVYTPALALSQGDF